MVTNNELRVDLRHAIYALSDALDLVGIDEVQHGKRVAFMAVECARAMGFDEARVASLLYAGLLHDCGVSSTKVHRRLITELEWDAAQVHCRNGYALLQRLAPLSFLAPIVLHHHTMWQDYSRVNVSAETAVAANLIFLADRVDALAAPYYGQDVLEAREPTCAAILERRGRLFSPDLVDAFLAVSSGEAFWLALEPIHIVNFLWEEEKKLPPWLVGFEEFRHLANMFAHIVDAKSEFTLRHSQGVACLARYLGEKLNLPSTVCDKLEIAGLLHDLGKLHVPDEILDKPGTLTSSERNQINRHSFESYQVLRRISCLQDIALWAAYHHEAPSGQGYPFHIKGVQLSREARLIAVADVFQALAQKRPYRDALEPTAILEILRDMANKDRLDRDMVDLVASDLMGCWRAAITSEMQYAPDAQRVEC